MQASKAAGTTSLKAEMTAGEKLDYIKSVVPELGGFDGQVRLSAKHPMHVAWYSLQDHSISINEHAIDTLYALCIADPVHAVGGLRVIASHELSHAESFVNPKFMAAMAAVAAKSFGNTELAELLALRTGKVKSFYELFHSIPGEVQRRELVLSFQTVTETLEKMDMRVEEAAAEISAVAKTGFEPFIDSIALLSVVLPKLASAAMRDDRAEWESSLVPGRFLRDVAFGRWNDSGFVQLASFLYPEIAEGVKSIATFDENEVVWRVGGRIDAMAAALAGAKGGVAIRKDA